MMKTIEDKIRFKQMQISIEDDPNEKQLFQKELEKLQLEKEIAEIRKKIEQLK